MKNRLVCECCDIWVDDIKKALENGADSFEDLERSMRLGVLCSACIGDSKKVIEELKSELGI
ncbi:MAG: (2Fe-2S)-binding protein [Clostridia bacterium]|nr:(2Fe-2S)-binding protein [Clostridia bacterium]